MTEENRYTRQIILPECGEKGQLALRNAHVLVVGAGGLGCPALQYLVAAGIGKISIIDADIVSRSNLHRQILYRDDQVGQSKVDAAKSVLEALNPDCEIISHKTRFDASNVETLIKGVDIALDCADNFATSYVLSDKCFEKSVPMVSASALGLSGYVGTFCAGAPSLRAIFPDLPSRAANCNTAGVLGPVVGTIGALQAQMTLNILLDIKPSPLGQLITINCSTFAMGGFRFDKASEPDGKQLTFISPNQITSQDFVVELRDEEEAPIPAHRVAKRFLVPDFKKGGPQPDKGKRAVLCCKTGLRSWQAAKNLRDYWDGDIALIAMGDE